MSELKGEIMDKIIVNNDVFVPMISEEEIKIRGKHQFLLEC
jgi:hypothetical protein